MIWTKRDSIRVRRSFNAVSSIAVIGLLHSRSLRIDRNAVDQNACQRAAMFLQTADCSTWREKSNLCKLLSGAEGGRVEARDYLSHFFLTDMVNCLVDTNAKTQQLVECETIRAFPIVAILVALFDLNSSEFAVAFGLTWIAPNRGTHVSLNEMRFRARRPCL